MTIDKKRTENEIIVSVGGRLDTTTAPELEKSLDCEFANLTSLEFDFSNLEYLSSAGLRVILSCQKIMNKQGKMVVRNASAAVREIFDLTGFSEIITIE